MTRWPLPLLAAFIAFSVAPAAALANMHRPGVCHHHHEIKNWLLQKFGETVRGSGMSEVVFFQLWVDEADGSWSATITWPDNITCQFEGGKGWNFFPAPPPGDPA